MNHNGNANLIQIADSRKPYATMGAGRLASTLWKEADRRGGWRYRFNLFRMSAPNGHVSQRFRPEDLPDLVKLVQILSAALTHDGGVPDELSQDLCCLRACLDDLLGVPGGPRAGFMAAIDVAALAALVTYVWETECRHFAERPELSVLMPNVLQLQRWLDTNRRRGGGSVVL